MKGLRVGDRVRTRSQQYHFAYLWGTGTIIDISVDEYNVSHDAGTRLGVDGTSRVWHPQHHIRQADVQFRDVVFDYIPYVNAQDCKRLLEIGYTKNVHFRLVDEREDHMPIG